MDRIVKATGYSFAGLKAAWRTEAAFRQEAMLCVVLMPLGLWLGNTGLERAVMIGALLLVLIVELVNSGLEAVVDRIGSEINPLSKTAKNLGSAAVFLSLLNAVVIWALVLT
ncbi:MAG: diacylglycerol kinase [Alphaproteobacteria bacterium]|nr:diacylglycerol kinase [Alphaproteobacteria bacterium]